MFKNLFNLEKINWWILLGGIALNLTIVLTVGLLNAYVANHEATAETYRQIGGPILLLVIFLACGLAGYLVGKMADDEPVKYAFLSSLGAAVPMAVGALLFNLAQLLLAIVAVLGGLNGGVLSLPRHRHSPPPSNK
jgi:hypothetical protein